MFIKKKYKKVTSILLALLIVSTTISSFPFSASAAESTEDSVGATSSTYTIYYQANGGTGSMEPTVVTYGVTSYLRKNTFTNNNYKFAGWYVHRKSDNKWVYRNAADTDSGWYKEGSQPSGWVKALYSDGCKVSKTSSVNDDIVTMYAQWQYFTVKYYPEGGSGSMADTRVYYDVPTTLRKNTFQKAGRRFTGWTAKCRSDNKWRYRSADKSKSGWYEEGKQPSGWTKDVYKDQHSILATSSVHEDIVEMHATWDSPSTFTFQYNANGGTGSMEPTVVTYGVTSYLRKNTFTNNNYKFCGWYLHKKSDNKWLYRKIDSTKDIDHAEKGWYLEGSQPSGWVKGIYPDEFDVLKTSSVDNDVITLYAQWEYNQQEYDLSAFTYNVLENNTCEITGYTGSGEEIIIPPYIDGHQVTKIADNALSGKTLTDVTIPETVTSIGDRAFAGCSSLKSVTFPDSVKRIGDYSFFNCTSLANVTIPGQYRIIGNWAFASCSSLKSVTIPSFMTQIGVGAFGYDYHNDFGKVEGFTIIGYRGSSAETYANNNGITFEVMRIASGTTGDCTWTLENDTLTISGNGEMGSYYDNPHEPNFGSPWRGFECNKVIISDGVTNIGNYAFCFCENITSVTIADSVTSIGQSAFYGCSRLDSVTIPESVTSIDRYAFGGCSSLTSVTIRNSVTSIGYEAFCGCSSLASVTIPDSVTSIGDYAFYGCTNLATININDETNGLKNLGYKAFEETEWYNSQPDGVVYLGNIVCGYKGESLPTSVIIENRNRKKQMIVACGLLYNNTELESVTFEDPDNVEIINAGAFLGCKKLKKIDIPNNVKRIGNYAFAFCENLSSLNIPYNVMEIGDYAFLNCSKLNSVTVPPNVKSIGKKAFGYYINNVNDSDLENLEKVVNLLAKLEENYENNDKKITTMKDFTMEGKINSAAYTYANKNGFAPIPSFNYEFLWGTDNLGFDNDKETFYKSLNNSDDERSFFNGLSTIFNLDAKKMRDNIYENYFSDWKSWTGSCFGMTVAEILVKQGLLSLTDNKENLNKYEKTDNIIKIINYLQELQFVGTNYVQADRSGAVASGSCSQEDLINKVHNELYNNDSVILIDYYYNYKKEEYPLSHAVLGYGIQEAKDLSSDEEKKNKNRSIQFHSSENPAKNYWSCDITGNHYDKRILIADPNHLSQKNENGESYLYDDACIYYDSKGNWICPCWNNGTDQCYYNGKASDPGQINLLIKYNSLTDPEFYPEVSEDYIAGLTIINQNGKPEITGDGITEYAIPDAPTDRVFYALENSKKCSFEYNNPSDFHVIMDYEHVTYYADVKNGKSMSMTPDGSIKLTGENATYSLTIMPDKTIRGETGWNSLTVSGKNANRVKLTKQDNRYLLQTDKPGNVTITAKSDSGTITQEFSKPTRSVFICSEDSTIKVTELEIGDVNCDGYVNVKDVTALQRYLAEFNVEFDSSVADTNGDGTISVSDSTQLQKYLAEIITQLG